MEQELKPDKCRFCGSNNYKVVKVDQQWSEYIYAVQCQSCWAEGSHCVTEELAVRLWGIAPMTRLVGE